MLGKLVKILAIFLYLIVFVGLLLLQLWSNLIGSGLSVSSYLYWLILIGWIFAILKLNFQSFVSLSVAFILFVFSAMMVILDFKELGETIMRISFIGWLVGLSQALIEYKRELALGVLKKAEKLEKIGYKKYLSKV